MSFTTFIGLGKAPLTATRNDILKLVKGIKINSVKSIHQEYLRGPSGVWYLAIDTKDVPLLQNLESQRHHIGLSKSLVYYEVNVRKFILIYADQ